MNENSHSELQQIGTTGDEGKLYISSNKLSISYQALYRQKFIKL